MLQNVVVCLYAGLRGATGCLQVGFVLKATSLYKKPVKCPNPTRQAEAVKEKKFMPVFVVLLHGCVIMQRESVHMSRHIYKNMMGCEVCDRVYG